MKHAALLLSLLALPAALSACATPLEICSTLNLKTGEVQTLEAIQPGNVTTGSDLTTTVWSSSDDSVVRVEADGDDPRFATITAVGEGTATLEVREGGPGDTCEVTVDPAANVTINVLAGAFQMVEPMLGTLRFGEEGVNAVGDTAYFLDEGESETQVVDAGSYDLTFYDSTNWAIGGDQYRLVGGVDVADGVDVTIDFSGDASEYEVVD